MARWITFWQGFGKCLFYFTSFSPQTCSDILSSQNLICVFNLCFWSQNRNVASSTSKKIFQRLLGTIGVFQRTSWKVSKREFNICANPSSAACATFDNRPKPTLALISHSIVSIQSELTRVELRNWPILKDFLTNFHYICSDLKQCTNMFKNQSIDV